MSIMEFLIPKRLFYVKTTFDVYIQNKKNAALMYMTYVADNSFTNQLCQHGNIQTINGLEVRDKGRLFYWDC